MTSMSDNSLECNVGTIPVGGVGSVQVNVMVPHWANAKTVVNNAYLYSYDYSLSSKQNP